MRQTPCEAERPRPCPPARAEQEGVVRFAAQEIVDADGRIVAHELHFRWNAVMQPDMLAPGEFLTSAVLANALLDAGVAGQTPSGRLFINMDEPTLMGPLAELVPPQVGAIDLTDAVAIDTPVLMRVAQLRSRGHRFSIDGLRDIDDPRWLLAPYADCIKLDLMGTRSDQLEPIAAKAMDLGIEVIGKRVESMVGYRRLTDLGVTQFLGRFISPPVDIAVPALPGCDGAVVLKVQRLLADRASSDAIAATVATDPALVMRLLILHQGRMQIAAREPEHLAVLLSTFPPPLLAGWLRVLLNASCHGRGAAWTDSVRREVDRYRRSVGAGSLPLARDTGVWEFQRRLCNPRHYFKTLRHAA